MIHWNPICSLSPTVKFVLTDKPESGASIIIFFLRQGHFAAIVSESVAKTSIYLLQGYLSYMVKQTSSATNKTLIAKLI